MAPPSWAYQVDQFEPPPDEELVCSICRGVFCDPVQSPCNHVFCRDCISKWLDRNRLCPICRKRTPKVLVQEVVPLVKNMIMKLTLRCHNSARGCEEKITLERCESHLKECTYEMVRCRNRPCKEKLARRDIIVHETEACPHRYTRCKTCCMKVSSTEQETHNCVKALKHRLKLRNETLKKKNKKIKELQDEIKTIKENEANQEFSDSSLSSISAGDVMIDLPALSGSTSMDSTSYLTDDGGIDDGSFWLSTSDILEGLESNYHRRRRDSSEANENDSVEYPRTLSPAPGDSSGAVAVDAADSTFDDDPVLTIRRPAKRRHPNQFLDTSDDDNQDFEQAALSSPKRSWCMFSRDNETSRQSASMQADASADIVSPSSSGAATAVAGSSRTSENASDAASNGKTSFKLRPKLNKVSPPELQGASATPSAAPRNGSGIFERTLSLLEQYNLESDPEWLPASSRLGEDSDGSLDQNILVVDGHISSSDESSLSDSSSSSSSSYLNVRKERNLFHCFYTSSDNSSSEDPDWQPE